MTDDPLSNQRRSRLAEAEPLEPDASGVRGRDLKPGRPSRRTRRENRQGSDLVLDNLTPPEHPTDPTFGTLKDRLRDLHEVEGLLESEIVSEDEREVTVVFWVDAESEVEAQIVGTIAYWSGCWSAEMPLPVGGSIEPLPA